jgi:hypothetical protein
VIFTVFGTTATEAMQWQSELLEYSWGRVKQPGELVRLVGLGPHDALPRQRLARVVGTLSWSPHPYTGDVYPAYNTAASLLEWLFAERIEGTILLVEPHCVFRAAVATEVAPGAARAAAWPGLPRRGEGPFGLGPRFAFLDRFCVNRTLEPPAVKMPLLIHSSDLRKLAARWLELTSIIRAETAQSTDGSLGDADEIAYAVAAAEGGIPHAVDDLAVDTSARDSTAPLLDYSRPIESERAQAVWDERVYRGWDRVDPQGAAPGTGREFLAVLEEYVARRAEGGELAFLRPRRRTGVRVGRVLDQTVLEIPGRADALSLNPSAAAIWDLCDGARGLADLTRELATRFDLAPEDLRSDVHSVIDRLERVGALDLEPV